VIRHPIQEGERFSFDKEKYREMILDAAETVLGYFGFDMAVYGNKNNTGARNDGRSITLYFIACSS
jgi:hypothetical protein